MQSGGAGRNRAQGGHGALHRTAEAGGQNKAPTAAVNIAGSTGSRWDAYKENFSEEHWGKETVKSIQEIIDAAAPVNSILYD